MAFRVGFVFATFSVLVSYVACEMKDRTLLSSPIQVLEQKLQDLNQMVYNLNQSNTYLNQEVLNLKQRLLNLETTDASVSRRVTELESYRLSRRPCETGSQFIGVHAPATLKLPQTKYISFTQPFQKIPIVTVGISELDVNSAHNLRVRVQATLITPTGFSITFSDWWDSDTYSVTATWIACPNE